MTILLVDRPEVTGARLTDMVRAAGHEFRTAADPDQAFEIFREDPPFIVVYHLSGLQDPGLGLCRKIRQTPTRHYPYFILTTENPDPSLTLPALAQGVDACLSVPLNPQVLAAQFRVGLRIAGFRAAGPGGRLKRETIGEYDIALAKIALENRWLSKEQLARLFSIQQREKQSGPHFPLAELALSNQMLTQAQVDALHNATARQMDQKFSVLAVKTGLVTREQVDLALDEQAREFRDHQEYKKTGDILVAQGVITSDQRDLLRQGMAAGNGNGPDLFEIRVSEDKMSARLFVKSGAAGRLFPDTVLKALEREGIRQVRVDEAGIRRMLDRAAQGENDFLVAQGRPPRLGQPAKIRYFFDTDHLTAGTIDADGNMDYQDRGNIPRVAAGDLLAVKTPAREGSPGATVHNQYLAVPLPLDLPLKCGEGTRLSEDGLSVYAAIDGQPHLAVGGTVSVFSELTIDGDVGLHTGNIEFDGNVTVHGTIREGFTVRCGALKAREIFRAVIVAMGDVTVAGGIIGANIRTEGNVSALFVVDANIKAFGGVSIQKEVIDTKIRSSSRFSSPRGKIISSFISAKLGCEAKDIGTDVSRPCRINVGMDENKKKRIQAFDYAIQEKKEELEKNQALYEAASERQQALHSRIAQESQMHERLMESDRSVNTRIRGLAKTDSEAQHLEQTARNIALKLSASEQALNRLFQDQETLEEKITFLLTAVEESIREIESISDEKKAVLQWSKEEKGDPVITVHGIIAPRTALFGPQSSFQVKEALHRVTLREVKDTNRDIWRMMIMDKETRS